MRMRRMNKFICSLMMLMGTACAGAQTSDGAKPEGAEVPKVYMLKEINSANLVKIYEALGREATGKVAVKLSTGEPGGHNFLQPALIKDLVQKVDGTIVECNTAYGGGRSDTESHRKAAEEHGFTAIAPVDIMDAEGEARLPVSGGKHIAYDIVGSHYMDYHRRAFALQGACDGWIWRSHQEHFHRHSFFERQTLDSFGRSEHDKLGESDAGRFSGDDG